MPILRSGKRVVISTGTKNLQEQLFLKDVPFLEQALFGETGGELSVCYMKGRNNYLCRQEALRPDRPAHLERTRRDQPVPRHRRLGKDHGDRRSRRDRRIARGRARSGRSSMPAPRRAPGKNASSYDRCFITEMRRRAMESDIIIVNHHLFFADLAIKQLAEDAHRMRESCRITAPSSSTRRTNWKKWPAATSASRSAIFASTSWCATSNASLQMNKLRLGHHLERIKSLRERSQFFFSLLPPGEGRFAFDNRREFLEENGDEFIGL